MIKKFLSSKDRNIQTLRYLYKLIYNNEPVSKSRLEQLSGFKLTTLTRYISILEEEGIIQGVGVGMSTGGRRPNLYSINPEYNILFGIDISRTYYKICLLDLKGRIIKSVRFDMETSSTPEIVVKNITEAVTHMKANRNKSWHEVLGLGIGAVGPLDTQKGIILNPHNFPARQWVQVPIADMVKKELEVETMLDNGANCAVLGEYVNGVGDRYESIAYINLGVGIRSGVITGGNIVKGFNNTEDALGHVIVDLDGKKCYCGNHGCMDAYVSIPSIVESFDNELKKGRHSIVNKLADSDMESVDILKVFNAAENGDSLAQHVVSDAAVFFGTGLANFINLLNPEIVIISGPVIKHSKLFYQVCTDTALKKSYSRTREDIKFSTGVLDEDAICVGAGLMIINRVFKTV